MSASPRSLPASDLTPEQPARKRVKRSYIACRRCHAHKVKCSGGEPCLRCKNTQNESTCEYPSRDRKVAVAESYLKRLEAESRSSATRVDVDESIPPDDTEAPSTRAATQSRPSSHEADIEIANPLKDTGSLQHQQFIGESTCATFASRLLQCIQPEGVSAPSFSDQHYVQRAEFSRQITSPHACKFPDRIRANLLVRIALRFIGQDYHFFLHKEFLDQLEKVYVYRDAQNADPIWACKFFVVLALGELYAGTLPAETRNVPGTDYFVNAVLLLQDTYEEPSLTQIEIMLLFCFYSNALGRIKSAHIYSGLAVRFSTSLGLHRRPVENANLTNVELEHRIRLWWTAYAFDRSLTSRLGQPLGIRDEDIDVRLPSSDQLSPAEQDQIGIPAHLNANVELARIEGTIMRDIYSPSSATRGSFLHNVRTILKSLRKWDANVAPSLRWSHNGSHRSVASLQLHFNQCIILTTRPVLLHVLKIKDPFARNGTNDATSTAPLSDTAVMLADSCVTAARTSNSILSQLYVENALAMFGHFDAHYLFASTLVLIISAIIAPNSSDSDAVQTAFHLLRTMRDSGNVSAAQYYGRLLQIQLSVGRMRAHLTARGKSPARDSAHTHTPIPPPEPVDIPTINSLELENYDWGDMSLPELNFVNFDWTGLNRVTVDPLDNPLLQTFLDHADAGWDENIGFVTGHEIPSFTL